jgi:hypothetical protein
MNCNKIDTLRCLAFGIRQLLVLFRRGPPGRFRAQNLGERPGGNRWKTASRTTRDDQTLYLEAAVDFSSSLLGRRRCLDKRCLYLK